MATVEIAGLRKTFGATTAVDDVSLTVDDGEFFVLLGPSGAGKTTTLKCVAGLERPDRGRVCIGGRDVSDVEPYDRNVAMAFESYALYPQQTVSANLSFPLRSSRHRLDDAAIQTRVQQVADALGIRPLLERFPRELSNGQRQRVALGRTLVRAADVMLLDEPLSHLDAKLRAQMRAELRSLGALERTTSIYVTHDYVEAVALGDRIGVLRHGTLVQVGTRQELWDQPADTFVARALGQPEINLLEGAIVDGDGEQRFRSRDGAVDIALADRVAPSGTDVTLGLRPRDLTVVPSAGGDGEAISGQVFVSERLGRKLEVTVDAGDQRLVALTDTGPRLEVGDAIHLQLATDRTLVFDGRDGRRLSLASPDGGVATHAG